VANSISTYIVYILMDSMTKIIGNASIYQSLYFALIIL